MMAQRAYIGIGSNLGDRAANVERAIAELAALGTIARTSSLYRTRPWGRVRQPWFLNAVVALDTALAPLPLLEELRSIETRQGRLRGERWSARTIDLDLLVYDDLEIDEPNLRVPHPRMRERAFVLVPLAEIDARFAPLRDALPETELAGVVREERESVAGMSEETVRSASERVRALARFLNDNGMARVRVVRGDDDIEIRAMPGSVRAPWRADERSREASAARVDTIKADLVGIFHASRPAPIEGETFDGDRELGYIEALGIRTPVHSLGAGRLVSIVAGDGAAVEYGQPLFLVARGARHF